VAIVDQQTGAYQVILAPRQTGAYTLRVALGESDVFAAPVTVSSGAFAPSAAVVTPDAENMRAGDAFRATVAVHDINMNPFVGADLAFVFTALGGVPPVEGSCVRAAATASSPNNAYECSVTILTSGQHQVRRL